jgi:hypothetical protein
MPQHPIRFATLVAPRGHIEQAADQARPHDLVRGNCLRRWRFARAIGPPCKHAHGGCTFSRCTRVFEVFGSNVLQPRVLSSARAESF